MGFRLCVPTVVSQFPNNAMKPPTFYGTSVDPNDSSKKMKSSPAAVISTLSRMVPFSRRTVMRGVLSDELKLIALIQCFPPSSAAQFWYESDGGKSSFATYQEFRQAFLERFGPNKVDEAKYYNDFLHVSMSPKESVASYCARFVQLLAEMKAIGKPVEDHWQLTKNIDGCSAKLACSAVSR
jgi:hypothetical protein